MQENCVVILLLFFACGYMGVTNAIDMDYYFSSLRNNDCLSRESLQKCKKICNEVPVLCHEGECYCHQSIVNIGKPHYQMASLDLKQEVQIKVRPQLEEKKSAEDTPEIMLTYEALRPALRHHIAHFCPDLDVARKCIRKCMETGKPAFCGKDHVCYCGHKYNYHDSKDKNNVQETYKEFADMYAKYLGTGGSNLEASHESEDSGEQSNSS